MTLQPIVTDKLLEQSAFFVAGRFSRLTAITKSAYYLFVKGDSELKQDGPRILFRDLAKFSSFC